MRNETTQETLAEQLEQWNSTVDLYSAKAESASDQTKTEFSEITAALQRMQDEVRMKLQRFNHSGVEEAQNPEMGRGRQLL